MERLLNQIMRKLIYSVLLLIGVTLISFLLMVYFGPDQTYSQLGKSATPAQIEEVRHQLGYDRPFLSRYGKYVRDLFMLNLGNSVTSGESVSRMLARTIPVSLALVLPGFILGNLMGIGLGLVSAYRQNSWLDRTISGFSIAGMSLSFLVVIIAAQVFFSTPFGLNLFPVRGWQVSNLPTYLYYVAVPTFCLVSITVGYNTRFYRAVFIDEYASDHIRTQHAFGTPPSVIMLRHVLKNSLVPLITRIMFSIPLVVISGSLLIESYFGIPGVGKATFEAISSGDQPVLQAIVGLTAVLFVLAQFLADLLYRLADPRIKAADVIANNVSGSR
jgi:peptide/nickel transport system permease protein